MTTAIERRMDRLQQKLKARTKRDGTPMPGYEQNVAQIKAEMSQLSLSPSKDDEDGQ